MKKSLILCILLLICYLSVYANQIDEARAITIAYEFMSGNGGSMQRAPLSISNSLTLSHTVSNADGNLLYVFNRGDSNGYVIVAGDDAVSNQVLGYSDEGSFDFDNIPPAMRGWMNGYACEIAQYRAMAAADAIVPYRTTFDKDVAPLTQARWGQEAPYNQYCPSYAGKYSATGCVATAMAQIMYHHQWPVTGVGSKEVAGTSGIEVIDFAHTTYQWSRMTPVYSSLSTPDECDAVATLMYHVGRSVNMSYGDVRGPVSADASSAWATYWNYDKAVIHRDRRYYTIDEWERMIMAEIDNDRPILYHGQSPEGGHAFVLDGYNSDGYVHINWGWNGMCNGYFLLQALSPEKQGTGGFAGGYNNGQGAIFGIQPNKGNKHTIEITAQRLAMGDDNCPITSPLSTVVTGLANASWTTASFGIGYMIYDSCFHHIATVHSTNMTINGSSSVGARNIMLTMPDTLSNGIYNVYLAHTDAYGQWKHVALSMNEQPCQTLRVNNGRVYVSTTESGRLWAVDVECSDSIIYSNRFTSFDVTMHNQSLCEYQGPIHVSIYEKSGRFEQRKSEPIAVSIPVGKEVNINIPIRIEVNKGTYCLYITGNNKEKLSDAYLIDVYDEPEVYDLELSDFKLVSTAQDELEIEYTVANRGGDYTGRLRSWILFGNLQATSSYSDSETITLQAGESKTMHHRWTFEDGVVGEEYVCSVWYQDLRRGGMRQFGSENIYFTLSNPTDVQDAVMPVVQIYPNPTSQYVTVATSDSVSHIEIYDARGTVVMRTTHTLIDVSNLPSGVYYVMAHTNQQCVVNKLLIK